MQNGRRPVSGPYEKLQTDPHFRDYVWFNEYFHGDNGRGLGASHQTGWTALVAKLLQPKQTPRVGPSVHHEHADGEVRSSKVEAREKIEVPSSN